MTSHIFNTSHLSIPILTTLSNLHLRATYYSHASMPDSRVPNGQADSSHSSICQPKSASLPQFLPVLEEYVPAAQINFNLRSFLARATYGNGTIASVMKANTAVAQSYPSFLYTGREYSTFNLSFQHIFSYSGFQKAGRQRQKCFQQSYLPEERSRRTEDTHQRERYMCLRMTKRLFADQQFAPKRLQGRLLTPFQRYHFQLWAQSRAPIYMW